jgi:hypothetical protein
MPPPAITDAPPQGRPPAPALGADHIHPSGFEKTLNLGPSIGGMGIFVVTCFAATWFCAPDQDNGTILGGAQNFSDPVIGMIARRTVDLSFPCLR